MKAALAILGMVLAAVASAEALGPRLPIYAGTFGGALIGLAGWVFAIRIAARFRGRAENARGDVWALWGGGMLARLVLIVACFFLLSVWMDQAGLTAGMLALSAVYLSLLFWEAGWLCQVLATGHSEIAHG